MGLTYELNTNKVKSKGGDHTLQPGEGRIERDQDGNVVKVITYTAEESDPDEMCTDLNEMTGNKGVAIIDELAKEGQLPRKRGWVLSDTDVAWLTRLQAKYGQDYEKMAWDMKMNPYQETAQALEKKFRAWKQDIEMI